MTTMLGFEPAASDCGVCAGSAARAVGTPIRHSSATKPIKARVSFATLIMASSSQRHYSSRLKAGLEIQNRSSDNRGSTPNAAQLRHDDEVWTSHPISGDPQYHAGTSWPLRMLRHDGGEMRTKLGAKGCRASAGSRKSRGTSNFSWEGYLIVA